MSFLENLRKNTQYRVEYYKRRVEEKAHQQLVDDSKPVCPKYPAQKVRAVLDSLVKDDLLTVGKAEEYYKLFIQAEQVNGRSPFFNEFIEGVFDELGDDVYLFSLTRDFYGWEHDLLNLKLHTYVHVYERNGLSYIPSIKKLAPKYRELAKANLQRVIDERAELEKQYHEELELYKKVLKGKEMYVEVYHNMERRLDNEEMVYDGIVSFFNERMKGAKNNEI